MLVVVVVVVVVVVADGGYSEFDDDELPAVRKLVVFQGSCIARKQWVEFERKPRAAAAAAAVAAVVELHDGGGFEH